jgi:hypothetical protein
METLNEMAKPFFEAVKKHTLLVIIDTASKADKAVFSLVNCKSCCTFSQLLKELNFKNYGREDDLFVTHCAGRYSLFILDNIGSELKGRGIRLPRWFYSEIQNQNVI